MKKIIFLSQLDLNLIKFRLPVMKHLVQAGVEVVVLIPKGECQNELISHGIIVKNYYLNRRSMNPLKELRTLFELSKYIYLIKPNVLHSFTFKPNFYAALIGRFFRSITVITTITGLGALFSGDSFFLKRAQMIILILYKIMGAGSNLMIFQNSDDLKFFIKKRAVFHKKAKLVKGSGIETVDWQRNDTKKDRIDKIIFIFIARFIKQKGLIEFCESAKAIHQKYPHKCEFQVIGDEDPGNKYSLKIIDIQPYIDRKDIQFFGWDNNIKKRLNHADVFVLPSYYREGIPRTGIEAASMSMPIITANTIGCKELVDHNQNGFLVAPRSVLSVVEAMEKFINNPDLIHEMGVKSREKAIEEFDINIIIKQYLECYYSKK